MQIVHFYRLLQVEVISKRENSLGYIGRQVNSLIGLSSMIFFSRLIQVKSIVEDMFKEGKQTFTFVFHLWLKVKRQQHKFLFFTQDDLETYILLLTRDLV